MKERAVEIINEYKNCEERNIEYDKRRIEELKDGFSAFDKQELQLVEKEVRTREERIQALDLVIESLQEDKVTLLYCVDGKVYVVDSKKSLDELSSESCDKCKRNEELDEIRKDFNFEPCFKIKPEPYKREAKMSWFKYCLTQLLFYEAHEDTNTKNKYLECKDCPDYDNCTNELKDKGE